MSVEKHGLLLVWLVLWGCTLENPEASEVLSLDVCPDGGCDYSADGKSVVSVKVCAVPVENRATDLKAVLTASEGSWQNADSGSPRELEVEFGQNQCRTVGFITSTSPTDIAIEAKLGGYTQSAKILQVPAAIESIVLTPAPATLTRDAPNTIQVSASVQTRRGVPSDGTTIEFSVVSTDPLDQFVGFYPTSPSLNENGVATTTIVVNQGVTHVVVAATATAAEREPVVEELELAVTTTAD